MEKIICLECGGEYYAGATIRIKCPYCILKNTPPEIGGNYSGEKDE